MALGSPRHCVLVCEDDPAMVRIFQFLLRQHGVSDVLTADNGEKVAALALKHSPALILLDLMLPGKDGFSVLRELKSNETTTSIPVIVVSGKESSDQVKEAMRAGAIDYVVKPFEPMELGARIKNFLDSLAASSSEIPPTAGFGGSSL